MKKLPKGLVAPVLAAALVLGVTAAPAFAYFTASDWASGGFTLKSPSTDITERYGNGEKDVTIVNNEDSVPVWVRARAYAASELSPTVVSGTDGSGNALWSAAGDGWWTYNEVVAPGEATAAPLVVTVEWPFTASDVAEDGTFTTTTVVDAGGENGGVSEVTINTAKETNYNIVVVYEAQPVKYAEDGSVLPADWS